jgi:hypothetical protein
MPEGVENERVAAHIGGMRSGRARRKGRPSASNADSRFRRRLTGSGCTTNWRGLWCF